MEHYDAKNDFAEQQRVFDRVPVNRFLGFRLTAQSRNEAVVEMDITNDHTQETGVLHGGILSGLADTAAVHLFEPYLPEHQILTSIEFKLNFLRPVRVGEGVVAARSRTLRHGRKVGVAEVEVTQADVLVAKGLFTYMFVNKSEWGAGQLDVH